MTDPLLALNGWQGPLDIHPKIPVLAIVVLALVAFRCYTFEV